MVPFTFLRALEFVATMTLRNVICPTAPVPRYILLFQRDTTRLHNPDHSYSPFLAVSGKGAGCIESFTLSLRDIHGCCCCWLVAISNSARHRSSSNDHVTSSPGTPLAQTAQVHNTLSEPSSKASSPVRVLHKQYIMYKILKQTPSHVGLNCCSGTDCHIMYR